MLVIIPVGKRILLTPPEDSRDVSNLPAPFKVFESLVAGPVVIYSQGKTLLSDNQSAYKSEHSCNTYTHFEYDKSNLTMLVVIDFPKAFDAENFSLLLKKLKFCFGFSYLAAKLIIDNRR